MLTMGGGRLPSRAAAVSVALSITYRNGRTASTGSVSWGSSLPANTPSHSCRRETTTLTQGKQAARAIRSKHLADDGLGQRCLVEGVEHQNQPATLRLVIFPLHVQVVKQLA